MVYCSVNLSTPTTLKVVHSERVNTFYLISIAPLFQHTRSKCKIEVLPLSVLASPAFLFRGLQTMASRGCGEGMDALQHRSGIELGELRIFKNLLRSDGGTSVLIHQTLSVQGFSAGDRAG